MKIVPKYHEFHWPVIRGLKDIGGSATIDELVEKVVQDMKIPDDIMAIPHGDGSRSEVEYRLAWARTYLKKVGALENSTRGIWSLTEKGRTFTEAKAKDVVRQVQLDNVLKRKLKREIAQSTEDDIIDSWEDALLKILGEMKPDAFERLCRRILLESGFTKVEVIGKPSDGGIDGVGVLRVNLVSFHVLFQCKRWSNSVGSETVRNFRGAMQGRADKGLIITTSTFSSEAKKEATRDGAPAIDLVDGEGLCALLKSLRLGVKLRLVEEVEVEPDFFRSL